MKIVGLDLSMNGSGLVKLTLDDNLDVIKAECEAFCSVKKHSSELVHLFKKKDYDNRQQINVWMKDKILKFVCERGPAEVILFGWRRVSGAPSIPPYEAVK